MLPLFWDQLERLCKVDFSGERSELWDLLPVNSRLNSKPDLLRWPYTRWCTYDLHCHCRISSVGVTGTQGKSYVHTVLVFQGCHNEGPWMSWLPQQRCVNPQFWICKSKIKVLSGCFPPKLWQNDLYPVSLLGLLMATFSHCFFLSSCFCACLHVQISPCYKGHLWVKFEHDYLHQVPMTK